LTVVETDTKDDMVAEDELKVDEVIDVVESADDVGQPQKDKRKKKKNKKKEKVSVDVAEDTDDVGEEQEQ
jgi:hypothetical protein